MQETAARNSALHHQKTPNYTSSLPTSKLQVSDFSIRSNSINNSTTKSNTNMAQVAMAPVTTSKSKISSVASKFSGTGGGLGITANSTFANSKFFIKKQNRAATKIQAICRAFLVQARIFRQRVLEPRLQDLKDCEARRLEELRRIQEQKELERKELPEQMKKEMESVQETIDSLKSAVSELEKDNDALKQEHKALKRRNKELKEEASRQNDEEFKLQVQNNKITKENKYLEETYERYKYALEGGKIGRQELEKSTMKEVHGKNMLKRYITKIIKLVEDRGMAADGAPKKDNDSSSPAKPSRRKHLTKSSSVRGGKKKHSSSKNHNSGSSHGETAMFDWASHSQDLSKTPIVLEDEETGENVEFLEKMVEDDSHRHNNNSSQNSKRNHQSHSSHNNSGGGSSACFDWATQSYNWSNQSIHLDEVVKVDTAATKERRARRGSKKHSSSRSLEGHMSSKSITKDNAFSDLVHELKTIKKGRK